MANPEDNPIQPQGDLRYNEGDAWVIPFEALEQWNDEYEPWDDVSNATPINLTNVQRIEFYVKEERIDRDEDALLEKTSTGGGSDDGDVDGDIEINDAENGRYHVHIKTGDTAGFLDETNDEGRTIRKDEKTFYWVVRIVDSNGNRTSSEVGTWTIHAS